jgi:purine-nucleoside phosphorylase
MSEAYSRRLMGLVERIALELQLPLQRAVFVCVTGPNLETAAEYRFLRAIGAGRGGDVAGAGEHRGGSRGQRCSL